MHDPAASWEGPVAGLDIASEAPAGGAGLDMFTVCNCRIRRVLKLALSRRDIGGVQEVPLRDLTLSMNECTEVVTFDTGC